MAYYAIKLI